ncbi:hypothetical protein cyc_05880 [Cyclospora cayetanensis]|uniref:Uncharacterized protein n=1 Tax=Cyclospora cayetanensis TaxID=88456 RepID=A0A1D3DAL2_9EIME|nr:hypothetical protein cyc_05880 [Cyclospora cayetanensis]
MVEHKQLLTSGATEAVTAAVFTQSVPTHGNEGPGGLLETDENMLSVFKDRTPSHEGSAGAPDSSCHETPPSADKDAASTQLSKDAAHQPPVAEPGEAATKNESEEVQNEELRPSADYSLVANGLVDMAYEAFEAARPVEELPPPAVGEWVESKAAHQDAQIFRAKVVERFRHPEHRWVFRLRSPEMASCYVEPLKHVRKGSVWSIARELDLAGGRKARRLSQGRRSVGRSPGAQRQQPPLERPVAAPTAVGGLPAQQTGQLEAQQEPQQGGVVELPSSGVLPALTLQQEGRKRRSLPAYNHFSKLLARCNLAPHKTAAGAVPLPAASATVEPAFPASTVSPVGASPCAAAALAVAPAAPPDGAVRSKTEVVATDPPEAAAAVTTNEATAATGALAEASDVSEDSQREAMCSAAKVEEPVDEEAAKSVIEPAPEASSAEASSADSDACRPSCPTAPPSRRPTPPLGGFGGPRGVPQLVPKCVILVLTGELLRASGCTPALEPQTSKREA